MVVVIGVGVVFVVVFVIVFVAVVVAVAVAAVAVAVPMVQNRFVPDVKMKNKKVWPDVCQSADFEPERKTPKHQKRIEFGFGIRKMPEKKFRLRNRICHS